MSMSLLKYSFVSIYRKMRHLIFLFARHLFIHQMLFQARSNLFLITTCKHEIENTFYDKIVDLFSFDSNALIEMMPHFDKENFSCFLSHKNILNTIFLHLYSLFEYVLSCLIGLIWRPYMILSKYQNIIKHHIIFMHICKYHRKDMKQSCAIKCLNIFIRIISYLWYK